MKRYSDTHEKISKNVRRFRLFLQEFSGYSREQKALCVRKIDSEFYDEFKSFFNCYIRIMIGKE